MITQVSIGELVDKVTILSIKSRKIQDPGKLLHIQKELAYLLQALKSIPIDPNGREIKALEDINLKLWNSENAIREKEGKKEFDHEFIQIARAIYRLNDIRNTLKRGISVKYHSEFIEEKEYTVCSNAD